MASRTFLSKQNTPAQNIDIWQWNCRSFRNKAAALHNFIQNSITPPDVICLQVVGTQPAKLRNYYVLGEPQNTKVQTLVHRQVTAIQKSIGVPELDTNFLLIGVLPNKKAKTRTWILNIYSSPKSKGSDIPAILTAAKRVAGARDTLVVVGDFNAPAISWGYATDSPKGKLVERTIEDLNLSILNHPDTPTRTGNSVSRDTAPDLSLTSNAQHATWTNLGENLGSDHDIICTALNSPKIRKALGKIILTDWDKFRKHQRSLNSNDAPTSITEWVAQIKEAHKSTSKEITRTMEYPVVDRHLLRLWDDRRKLAKRWKRQKLNKKLQQRLSALAQESNEYARKLEQDNWVQFCSSLRNT